MIIGIFLIYFLGKAFYNLAKKAGKSTSLQWLFAVLGVLSYYVGTFIGGIIVFLIIDLFLPQYYELMENDIAIALIGLVFGIAGCWTFYTVLKNIWNKQERETYIKDDNILDADL